MQSLCARHVRRIVPTCWTKSLTCKRTWVAATLFATTVFAGSAFALKPGCDAPPCGGGNKPPGGETASNNLSYPVIFSDNVRTPDWNTTVTSDPTTWVFATFPDIIPSTAACLQETGVPAGTAVPPATLCYFGRPTVTNDDGSLSFVGDPALDKKVWWLQQRPANKWQAFNPTAADAGAAPVVVSAVDAGDLLESSGVIKAKQIRTEFVMYQNAAEEASPFGQYLDGVGGNTCDTTLPSRTACFVQQNMSGAVPFTQQSIYETAGSDYGPGTGNQVGTQSLPNSAKLVTAEDGTQFPVHATVYARCARLIIQKLAGPGQALEWIYGTTGGSWGPRSAANAPVVDLRAWDDSYSAEINAGGLLLYGYNWNTKTLAEGAGWYRLTFLLEGSTAHGGLCTSPNGLNTQFGATSQAVNRGERQPAELLSKDEFVALGATRGEGGAVYVEVQIGSGGGGGGTGKP